MMAAPVGLAACVVIAWVVGGELAALILVAMSKARTLILGVIFMAGLGTFVALQYHANTRLQGEIETLRSQLAERPRPQPGDQHSTDAAELERLRREHIELLRLRGEVASLRQRVAAIPTNVSAASKEDGARDVQQTELPTDAEVTEFLQRPPAEQGNLLGVLRGQPLSGRPPTTGSAHDRMLAEKVRPSLDQLESRPTDIADFQTAFIQSAVGLQDENKVAQIGAIIQEVYERAVAAHLDAPSRPQGGVEDWATRRDALDRQATRMVQQLLAPDERERFDRLFLGVMGIDLGIGDGARHRFVRDDGAVIFPSEQPEPSGQP